MSYATGDLPWVGTGQRKISEGFGNNDDEDILLVLLVHLRVFQVWF